MLFRSKDLKDLAAKFRAFGFDVEEVDGHDPYAIAESLNKGHENPFCLIAHTVKGKGVSFMENKCEWHGKAPKKEEYEIAISELEK